MIYSNVETNAKGKDLGCGMRYYLSIGEKRRPVSLWTQEGLSLRKGMNRKITIGINYRHKPCLLEQEDNHLYLFLYAEPNELGTARGEIKVFSKHAENVRVKTYFGQNKCLLAEVLDPMVGALVQVRPYGLAENEPSDLYVIYESDVYRCTADTLAECCKEHNVKLPAAFNIKKIDFNAESNWVTL